MVNTLSQSGACLLKAGSGANIKFRDGNAETNWSVLINQAEAFISLVSREDWVTKYSTLDPIIKLVLEDAVSSLAAAYAVMNDVTGYSERQEAEDVVSVNLFKADQIMNLLREQKHTTFVKNST
ncbi:hypothetical protein CMI37_38700 [Candidatus Pacearchaeota archaeon]|jgi:hypothetical protein|nr:hypothetical protein [Candidatus Pacearchaeota archaeon]